MRNVSAVSFSLSLFFESAQTRDIYGHSGVLYTSTHMYRRETVTRISARIRVCTRESPPSEFMNSAASELDFLPSAQCRRRGGVTLSRERTHLFSALFIASRQSRTDTRAYTTAVARDPEVTEHFFSPSISSKWPTVSRCTSTRAWRDSAKGARSFEVRILTGRTRPDGGRRKIRYTRVNTLYLADVATLRVTQRIAAQ